MWSQESLSGDAGGAGSPPTWAAFLLLCLSPKPLSPPRRQLGAEGSGPAADAGQPALLHQYLLGRREERFNSFPLTQGAPASCLPSQG